MTKEIKGITIILFCYLMGEVASRLIGGFMPGSIMGMLIFFGLLQSQTIEKGNVKGVANFVLNNMMLFFVPVTVGIVTSLDAIRGHLLAVVATIILSTIAVMVVVGFAQQIISKRWRK